MDSDLFGRTKTENFIKPLVAHETAPQIETSEKCMQELDRLRDLTDNEEAFNLRASNPDCKYESIFGDRYYGFSNGQKVEVQYYTGHNNERAHKVTVEEEGKKTRKEIMARMWVTDTTKQPPAALCYELTPDGNWYVQASDTYTRGAQDNPQEKDYNVWSLKKAEVVSREDTELNVFDRLRASTKEKTKAK